MQRLIPGGLNVYIDLFRPLFTVSLLKRVSGSVANAGASHAEFIVYELIFKPRLHQSIISCPDGLVV